MEQELKGYLDNNEHKDRQDTITGKNGGILVTWKPNGIIFAKTDLVLMKLLLNLWLICLPKPCRN